MTDARTAWIRSRERKRAAISWSAALLAYVVAMGIAALLSLFDTVELDDFSGPIVVRLGSPEGVDAPKPVEAPVPAAPPESRPAPVVPEAPAASQAPTKPTAPASPQPKTPVPVQPSPQASPFPPALPTPIVMRGSEMGNSYDMTIEAGSGRAGRSLYVPISLVLPIPFEVPAAIFDAIPDLFGLPGTAAQRQATFKSYYKQLTNGTWQLKNLKQPKYDERMPIWTMLEDAHYDLKNADYKDGKSLRPIVILFKVSAPGPDGNPTLEDVLVESSSGYSDIDDAVLYGFKKAEFSNSGDKSIQGRFTYRF